MEIMVEQAIAIMALRSRSHEVDMLKITWGKNGVCPLPAIKGEKEEEDGYETTTTSSR